MVWNFFRIFRGFSCIKLFIYARKIQMDDHRLQFLCCFQCHLPSGWQYFWNLYFKQNVRNSGTIDGYNWLHQCNVGVYYCRFGIIFMGIVCWYVCREQLQFTNNGLTQNLKDTLLFMNFKSNFSFNNCNAKRCCGSNVSSIFGKSGTILWNWKNLLNDHIHGIASSDWFGANLYIYLQLYNRYISRCIQFLQCFSLSVLCFIDNVSYIDRTLITF